MTTVNGSVRNRSAHDTAVSALNRCADEALGAGVLRKLREMQNLTQVDLAELLCVTQERVSVFEKGGLGRRQIRSLRRYIEALGGQLRVAVDLGGERIEIR